MINVSPVPLGQRAAVGGEVQDRTGPGPSAGGTRPCPQKPPWRPGCWELGTKLSQQPRGGDTTWGPGCGPNICFPDGDNYKELFGALDNAFLVAYAIGMFIRYPGPFPLLTSLHQSG